VLSIIFFVFTAVVLLRQVFHATTVTLDTIAGAICVYFLLSVVWAFTFSLIEVAHPGSFRLSGHPLDVPGEGGGRPLSPLLYLSLVTISTVGYGDIVPTTSSARIFAALEGVIGQLYLAVLVARLIALQGPPRSHHDP
jgi:Ion channel